MKHLLKMGDLTPAEVAHILDVADELKAQQKAGGTEPLLKGKSVALMFSKTPPYPHQLRGGRLPAGRLGNYMNAATELQSGRGEPLKDTAGCWAAIMTALSGAPTARAIWKSSLSLRASPSSMA